MLFLKGQRVFHAQKQLYGTVVKNQEDRYGGVYIRFDQKVIDGHDLKGLCEMGYGWRASHDLVKLIENPNEEFE